MASKITDLSDLSGGLQSSDYLVVVDVSEDETVKADIASIIGLVTTVDAPTGRVALAGVELGDTGWRDVSGDLINGWTASGLEIRRSGSIVELSVRGLDGSSASADEFYTAPAGFRPSSAHHFFGSDNSALSASPVKSAVATDGDCSCDQGEDDAYLSAAFTVEGTWPATLPGVGV